MITIFDFWVTFSTSGTACEKLGTATTDTTGSIILSFCFGKISMGGKISIIFPSGANSSICPSVNEILVTLAEKSVVAPGRI